MLNKCVLTDRPRILKNEFLYLSCVVFTNGFPLRPQEQAFAWITIVKNIDNRGQSTVLKGQSHEFFTSAFFSKETTW
jgi:hypothetical protein